MAAVLPVLAAPATAGALTLTGSGSSAAQPYMTALFAAYTKLHKNISFKYIPDGGNAGVKDVQAGRSEFAINTRPEEPSDSGTSYTKLFLDAICIDVNSLNSISNISLTGLKNVFLGTDTSWSQVGGSLSGTIDPQGRNSSAGQYTFFQSAVLDGATQSSNVSQLTSDGLVATAIEKDQNAIGYVGLAHSGAPGEPVKESGEKPIEVNGIACDAATVKSETYPLFRFDWAVLPTSSPSIPVEQFFDWVRTNSTAGQVISEAGAVPAFNAAPPKKKK